MFTYLLINILSAIIPFAFSFHPEIKFNREFKTFFAANFMAAFCFLIWDEFFVRQGIWGFNDRYITGIKIFHLPIEEILFFVCIPFACSFTLYSVDLAFKIKWQLKTEKLVVLAIAVLLCAIAVSNFHRAYTFVTFISTSIFLLLLEFVFKVKWLPQFLSIYPVLLVPFFIVNGILTGTGLDDPVVWYNNSENLGIRVLTIPVEDVAYGFELLLLNVFFYQRFKNYFSREKRRYQPLVTG
jgi:lycopene cyclase domain-containing protein